MWLCWLRVLLGMARRQETGGRGVLGMVPNAAPAYEDALSTSLPTITAPSLHRLPSL